MSTKNGFRKIAIIGGCGHVGFPLGLAFASVGHSVVLIDINVEAVEKINRGEPPFLEEGAEVILREVREKNLIASTDKKLAAHCDVLCFVTGTPIDEHFNPRIHDVVDVVEQYLPLMHEDMLLVMRSTVYPSIVQILDKLLHKKFSQSLLAFCPERIVQGKGIDEIFKLPQLVSATSPEAEKQAVALFRTIAPKTVILNPVEAEVAKLITNSWRYLEFAIANQFYMMVESLGLDFYKIYNALRDEYPRAAHYTQPGLTAGPCLLKDTMQLAAFYKSNFSLGQSAMLINEGLPVFLVEQLEKQLNSLEGKTVAILGMTFKADNDDCRDSLSFKIKKILEMKLAHVITCDCYFAELPSAQEAIARSDGVILAQPHREYRTIKVDKPYVDCWGIWDRNVA